MRQRFGLLFLVFFGLFVLSHAYAFFRYHLSDENVLRAQLEQAQENLQQEQFRVALRESELADLRAVLARNLPEFKAPEDSKANYHARNLASVVASPHPDRAKIDLSDSLFAEAQSAFRRRDFTAASKSFAQFVNEYPIHERTTEAYYLWTESEFLAGNEKSTLGLIKTMVSQFPDNPLTGYSLLRMGQVLEKKNRAQEAQQIYRSVFESYSEPKLKLQAKKLSNQVEI